MASIQEVKDAIPTTELVEMVPENDLFLEDDPHRAALVDNPEKPAPLSWSTLLAVFVRTILSFLIFMVTFSNFI